MFAPRECQTKTFAAWPPQVDFLQHEGHFEQLEHKDDDLHSKQASHTLFSFEPDWDLCLCFLTALLHKVHDIHR